jgi:citrate lyase subunit beta / citryl-CoA lyase
MMAIHPSQVMIINRAFTPSPEAVDRARKVVEAFRGGAGVVGFEGRMLDAPHLKSAQRILNYSDS